MKLNYIFTLILGFLFVTACNKGENKTVKELLTNKTWKITQRATDQNNNGILDGTEVYSKDSTVTVGAKINENGTGFLTFSTADTSGTATFSWTLDASNTYITTVIPALSKTIVSKILAIDDKGLSVILDTSATPKTFVFFEEE